MSATISENVFDRESRLLLHRLVRSRRWLIADESCSPPSWRLPGKRQAPLLPGLVEAMLARGLLMAAPDGRIRPSAAGLRRAGLVPDGNTLLGQHALIEAAAAPRSPAVNRTEWAVGWLAGRSKSRNGAELSELHIAAAERLRMDYEQACLRARLTADWERPISETCAAGAAGPGDVALEARRRFFAALDDVGPELAAILVEVCCLAAGLEQAERRLSLPRRAGKAVLRLALTALARHYRLLRDTTPAPHGTIRAWAMEGSRPEM